MADRPVVFLYNIDPKRKIKLLAAAGPLGISCRVVSRSDFTLKLSDLYSGTDDRESPYDGEGFRDPMILMAGFNDRLLNAFLNALHRSRTQPIGLKAVLTPVNAEWDSIQLHDSILAEHLEMSGSKGKKQ